MLKTSNELFFNYILARTGCISTMTSALYQTNTISWILSASSLKQHSTPTHKRDCEPTRFCFYSQCGVLSGEATNSNFIFFWLDPNHYTTDTVYDQGSLDLHIPVQLSVYYNLAMSQIPAYGKMSDAVRGDNVHQTCGRPMVLQFPPPRKPT